MALLTSLFTMLDRCNHSRLPSLIGTWNGGARFPLPGLPVSLRNAQCAFSWDLQFVRPSRVSNSAQYSEEILGDTIDGSIVASPASTGLGQPSSEEIKYAL